MKVFLVAPFRTFINLYTEQALDNPTGRTQAISSCLNGFKDKRVESLTTDRADNSSKGFQRFSTLGDDQETDFSLPICSIFLAPDVTKKILQNVIEKYQTASSTDTTFQLENFGPFTVDVFDNTIAVAKIDLIFTNITITSEKSATAIDQFTADLMNALICQIAGPVLQKIQQKLMAGRIEGMEGRRKSVPLLRRSQEFQIFDDIAAFSSGTLGATDGPSPMLWCNRTLVINSNNESELSSSAVWARHAPETLRLGTPIELIQAGNNLFEQEEGAVEFVATNIKIQYFYVLLDVLRESQKRIYTSVGQNVSAARLRKYEKRVHFTATFTEFILTELDDYILGLQSNRRRFSQQLYRAFDMERAVANLKQRSLAVTDKLNRLVEERGERRQRLIQSGIILIGGVQIFDFLLNSIDVAQSEPKIRADGVWGILDLLGNLPADGVLNAAIIGALLVALIYAARRRR